VTSKETFTCVRPRPVGQAISLSKVRDTVCDCCDGSDELPSQGCPNTCDAIEAQRAAEAARQRQTREQGETAFHALVEKASVCPNNRDALREKLVGLEHERTQLAAEQAKVTASMTKLRMEALRLSELSREQLEQLVVDLATRAPDGGDVLEELLAPLLCPPRVEGEDYEERCVHWNQDDDDDESRAVDDKLAATDKQIADVEAELGADGSGGGSTVDYGPGRVWRALKGECVKTMHDKYTYEMCLFGQAKQDAVLLGTWKEWRNGHAQMLFTGGQHCHATQAPRSFTVSVVCGLANKLVDIREPSTCSYSATLESPAACVPEGFDSQAVEEHCT